MSKYDLLPCPSVEHPHKCNIAHERLALEARIIRGLIRGLKAEGWTPAYVYTDTQEKVSGEKQTMDAVFSVDEATITFRKDGKRCGVLIVLGNGVDCISDYTYALGEDTYGWNAAIERITDELMEKYDG